jgi:hypothetical protein
MAKIYLSGPITGVPDYQDRFGQIACRAEIFGHTVIDPSVETAGLTPKDYMRISIARLEAADEVWLLPGWQNSKGATIEKLYAEYIGLPIKEIEGE